MAALLVHCCLYAYCGMVTFAAWRPLGPCTRSNSTCEPSASERKPFDWMAENPDKSGSEALANHVFKQVYGVELDEFEIIQPKAP